MIKVVFAFRKKKILKVTQVKVSKTIIPASG
jgi:hypothetical protein